jgi:hypothetical protein
MPLTTPFLSLTLSVSADTSDIATFAKEATPTSTDPVEQKDRALATRSAAPYSPAPPLSSSTSNNTTTAPARPSAHSRRLTLSRFPLLRKGSREQSWSPSTHFKGSSTAPPEPAESLFLSTGAPRASSSIARGPEISPARGTAVDDSHDTDVIVEDLENTPHAARTSTVRKPDKMHQTSSRLLRMTNDERPYTSVSIDLPQRFRRYPLVRGRLVNISYRDRDLSGILLLYCSRVHTVVTVLIRDCKWDLRGHFNH